MSATIEQVQESLRNISAGVTIVLAQIADQSDLIQQLKDQLANGIPVTQAQVDALEASAQAIEDTLTAAAVR